MSLDPYPEGLVYYHPGWFLLVVSLAGLVLAIFTLYQVLSAREAKRDPETEVRGEDRAQAGQRGGCPSSNSNKGFMKMKDEKDEMKPDEGEDYAATLRENDEDRTRGERIRLLETALVECFDIAIPQAMPWRGTFGEKATYAAKMLPGHLRGLFRLYNGKLEERSELLQSLLHVLTAGNKPDMSVKTNRDEFDAAIQDAWKAIAKAEGASSTRTTQPNPADQPTFKNKKSSV